MGTVPIACPIEPQDLNLPAKVQRQRHIARARRGVPDGISTPIQNRFRALTLGAARAGRHPPSSCTSAVETRWREG
eukprot:2920359-Rhodomonas_salina.2